MPVWDYFHTRAKCNLNDHSNDGILDRVYANLCRDAQFKWRSRGIFQWRISQAAKMPWPLDCDLGGGGMWPSNHFLLYTARCICRDAQETWAPCMFDWQGTQTRATHLLPLWNAKPQIWSLVSILRNSNIAVTSLVCTLRNSNCALCSRVKWWHGTYLLRWWHDTYRFCLSYLNDMGNGTLT